MKDIDKLFSNLYDLQRQGLVVDSRLVVDDGEVPFTGLSSSLLEKDVFM